MCDFKVVVSKKNFSVENLSFERIVKSKDEFKNYRNEIERIWQESLIDNPSLYNGKCISIDGIQIENEIRVNYQEIEYKTLLGLRGIFEAEKKMTMFPKYGAVGAVLFNNENYFFGVNSDEELKLIGGVIEANELNLISELKREINEEINIRESDLNFHKGLIIIEAYKAVVDFILKVEIKLDTKEILKKFEKRTDNEISRLEIISKNDITKRLEQSSRYFPLLIDIL
jgi:hypothetical protein